MRQNTSYISLVLICTLLLCTGTVCAKEITVGPYLGNSTITAALANATDGDMILVNEGTYRDNILITTDNITIRSKNGPKNTVISANNSSDNVFYINANNVTIDGFNITGATVEPKAGIYLKGKSNCTISNNSLNGNFYGIYMDPSSNYNNLTDNNANGNFFGICMVDSNHNTLSKNRMSANTYNLYIYASSLSGYVNNINSSNLVEKKPVYYLVDRSDEVIPSTAGIVYAINSSNITVNEVNISNEYSGIHFYETKNSTIENVRTSDCRYGIFLWNSSNNRLTANNASENTNGIFLYYSSNYNNLTGNNANKNNNSGIHVDASSNYNNLTGNNASKNSENGIYLCRSGNNILKANKATDNNYGIFLSDSDNNTLTDNEITDNNYGIYLTSSDNNTQTGNKASKNTRGIYLSDSTNNNLIGNNATDNRRGIYLYNSSNNTMTGNQANENEEDGFYISESHNNTLAWNTMSANNYNLHVDANSLPGYVNHINISNLVDNKMVYYLVDCSDEVIPSTAGVVYAINSSNITVNGLNISNDYFGVCFYETKNSTIENVMISDCCYGIYMASSSKNRLTDNNASGNLFGIRMSDSNNNTLKQNSMSSNTNNLRISASSITGHVNDIDTTNLVDNKPVYYLVNCSDEVIPSSAGVVYAINSSNVTVSGGNISNDYYGIYFYETRNSTIENTVISDCRYGIYLLSSSNSNNLTCNNVRGNYNGIYLRDSSNNNLTDNKAIGSENYDFISYAENKVNMLELTNKSMQLSFMTAASSVAMYGDDKNNNSLTGKINVNGYVSISAPGNLNVTFFYDDSGMSSSGESSIGLYQLEDYYQPDEASWIIVNDTLLDTSSNSISATAKEFRTYGLFGNADLYSEPKSGSSSSTGGEFTIRYPEEYGENQEHVATISTPGDGDVTDKTENTPASVQPSDPDEDDVILAEQNATVGYPRGILGVFIILGMAIIVINKRKREE